MIKSPRPHILLRISPLLDSREPPGLSPRNRYFASLLAVRNFIKASACVTHKIRFNAPLRMRHLPRTRRGRLGTPACNQLCEITDDRFSLLRCRSRKMLGIRMRIRLFLLSLDGIGKAFGCRLLCQEAGSGGQRSKKGSGWYAAGERGSCESSGLKDGGSEHYGDCRTRNECLKREGVASFRVPVSSTYRKSYVVVLGRQKADGVDVICSRDSDVATIRHMRLIMQLLHPYPHKLPRRML